MFCVLCATKNDASLGTRLATHHQTTYGVHRGEHTGHIKRSAVNITNSMCITRTHHPSFSGHCPAIIHPILVDESLLADCVLLSGLQSLVARPAELAQTTQLFPRMRKQLTNQVWYKSVKTHPLRVETQQFPID